MVVNVTWLCIVMATLPTSAQKKDMTASDESAIRELLNAEEFMQFAHQNEAGRLSGVGFLLSHPNTAAPALTRTGKVDSVVTLQYWAGGAFHLGAHQAVKYSMKPCEGSAKRQP